MCHSSGAAPSLKTKRAPPRNIETKSEGSPPPFDYFSSKGGSPPGFTCSFPSRVARETCSRFCLRQSARQLLLEVELHPQLHDTVRFADGDDRGRRGQRGRNAASPPEL